MSQFQNIFLEHNNSCSCGSRISRCGGADCWGGGRQPLTWVLFSGNVPKMKELGPVGRRALDPPMLNVTRNAHGHITDHQGDPVSDSVTFHKVSRHPQCPESPASVH